MIKELKAKNGQFYNVLTAKNGRILMTSETTLKRAGTRNNAESVAKADTTFIPYSEPVKDGFSAFKSSVKKKVRRKNVSRSK